MTRSKKNFIGIMFECCRVYSRVYRAENENRYYGHCPKCLKKVSVRVDPSEGVSAKFLRAY